MESAQKDKGTRRNSLCSLWNNQKKLCFGCWLQPVTSVIIKNTKNIQTQITTKKQHWEGQNHQQKGSTTYIGGFAVLFFDGMSKEQKIQKDKVQSVIQKKCKNTKNIFGSNGKMPKNTKCIFQNLMINVCVCVLKRGISRTSLITSNSINQLILPYFQTNPCTEVVILLRIPNVQSKHIEAI